jgi:hypothetical protein
LIIASFDYSLGSSSIQAVNDEGGKLAFAFVRAKEAAMLN